MIDRKINSLKFPYERYDEVSDYALAYFRDHDRAWKNLDMIALGDAFEALRDCYKKRRWVYVCGNGGSAAIANHFLCDHGKLIATGTTIKPKVYSLSGSMEMMSALGNDISFDESFSHPLRNMGEAGDVLFTISASGDSENVVRAIKVAKETGIKSIALTAFDGGRSSKEADINIHFPAYNYGIAEDLHQGIMQILAQFIRQLEMTSEDIKLENF